MDKVDNSEWTGDAANLPDSVKIQIYQQLDHDVIYKDAETNQEVAECLQIMASRIKHIPAILVIATRRNSGNNGWLAQCVV